jgi:class 3 adenylate cyclase
MPLFMDRHDLPGVTAEEVAQAHLTDIQIESKHDVQFLAYWFDADHAQVFCLARAARPEDMAAVHRDGHGLVPNEIIAVSEDDVFRFLGRVNEPVDQPQGTKAFRTILFTDLKGSTSLLQEVGESVYMGLLDEHDVIIRRSLATWRGREVKHTGDGIMASFEDVANALECALAIQEGFVARMSGATRELLVRIGIAAGEPVDHNDDLYGSTVNLASRICDACDPGHILTSDLVHEIGTEKGLSFGPGRDVELKGFGSVRVFELARRGVAAKM